jgi:hypothetical protein
VIRLTGINVSNLRGLREAALTGLPPRVYVTGTNGSGKTTLLDAVRLVLAGSCSASDGKRIEIADLTGPAGKEAVVSLTLSLDGRELHPGIVISGKTSKLKWDCGSFPDGEKGREEFWRSVGQDAKRAECALSPLRYLQSDDLTTLLSGMSDVEVTSEMLVLYAGAEHQEWLHAFLAGRPVTNLKHVEALGKDAERRRTDVNKRFNDTKKRLDECGMVVAPKIKGRTLEVSDQPKIEGLLRDLRESLEQRLVDLGASQSAPDPEQLKSQIAELQAELNKSERATREVKEIADLNAKRAELDTAATKLTRETTAVETELKAAVAEKGQYKSGSCPTCKRKYTQENAEYLEALKDKIADLEERKKALAVENETAQKSMAANKKRVKELELAVKEAEVKRHMLEADIQDRQQALGNLETTRPAEELESEIAQLRERIARGEQVLESLRKMREVDGLKTGFAEVSEEKGHYDWAVKAFRDGTFQASLMQPSSSLSDWVATCNDRLSAYGRELRVEHGCVEVMSRDVWVPFRLCSSGERALVQAAVAQGFAGNGLVLLDEINTVDGLNKTPFIAALKKLKSETSIIAAGCWTQPQPPDLRVLSKALSPCGLVWVEGGAARLISPTPAA